MRMILKCALVGSLTMVIAGCGGGGGNSSPGTVATGVFIDAPVKGLYYESGTIKGKTDDTGTYTYITGQPVIFKLGKVVVGTADGSPIITPKDLAKKADPSLSGTGLDDAAKKIVRFLLSVGTSSGNTLDISQAVYGNASSASNLKTLNILKDDISSAVTALGGTLATPSAVDSHYAQYMSESFLGKAKFAGRYVALNTAISTGLDVLVSPDGTLKGVAAYTDGNASDITGAVDANGNITGTAYKYGTSTVEATFTGTFSDGKFTIVTTPVSGAKSTWVIQRTTDYLNPVAGIYSGTFTGGISGKWGIIVLTNGSTLGYANGIAKEACSGTIDAAGKASLTCSGGAKVAGTIVGSSASGTWTEGAISGTFTGNMLVTTR